MEKINFMSPLNGVNATKTFIFEEGEWKLASSYQAGKWLMPYSVEKENLNDFYETLRKAQDHPCFMIHGEFKDGVDLTNPIVRRKRVNPLDDISPTIQDRKIHIVCLDVDGWSRKRSDQTDLDMVRQFIRELPEAFHNADYIYQFSASHGLLSNKLKCHLFFWIKNSILNTDIQKWIRAFNEFKGWGNLLDPSMLTCTQPVYVQKRICEGAEDPIKKFLGYAKKDGELDFDFKVDASAAIREDAPFRFYEKYDLAGGIQKILTSVNFHDEINSLALSLLNQKVSPKFTKKLLEGAMNAAKRNLTDPERLADWQIRFDDIGRSVDSAAAVVGNPTIEELEDWVKESSKQEVRLQFGEKSLFLDRLDLKSFINAIELKLGVGVKNIKDTIKITKQEADKEDAEKRRKKISELRKKNNIHEIVANLSNTEEVCAKVSEILSNSRNGDRIFKAPGGLVRIGEGWPKTIRQVMKKFELKEDYPKMPLIEYLNIHSLGARLEKDIVFMNSKYKQIPAPANILKIVGEGTNSNFHPLSGIIEHPFVNTDFEIVQKNGYDVQTGLFTVLHHKLKLTLIDPKKAYDYLAYTVFDEFPFATDLDRCVAVSALLTCVQRPVIAGDSGFPGFGIVSPTQSSGKTTLAQLISYSIYNRAVAATSFSKDDSELKKHLIAILREGHNCVLFDNITAGSEVKSNVLAEAMSGDIISGRLLGENRTVEAPSAVIWLFTGNGIYFVGDFGTRVFPININPNIERPDTRHFKRSDIGQWAIEHRKETMSAIISIVLTAKNETEMVGASRFPIWDRFVRQPLFSIAKIDINEAIRDNIKNDSFLRAKINLLAQAKELFGLSVEFTTKELMKRAFTEFDGSCSELGSVLEEILDRRARSTRSVGRLLGRLRNVILGGLALRVGRFSTSITKWRIEEVQES